MFRFSRMLWPLTAVLAAISLGVQPVLAAVECACAARPAANCSCENPTETCGCQAPATAARHACCTPADAAGADAFPADASQVACRCLAPADPVPAQPEPPASPRIAVPLALLPLPADPAACLPALAGAARTTHPLRTTNQHQALLGVWLK